MENVTEAYHALTATIPVGESLPPPPKQTHVYVKFMPKDAKQLEMLTSDPNLEVYDHPVDYTVVKDGHFYRDPKVEKGQPTYQYATISVHVKIPDYAPYEILEEISISEDEKMYEMRIGNSPLTFGEALVKKSLELTGNLDSVEEAELENQANNNTRWTPRGSIKVRDIHDITHNTTTDDNLFRVEGVRVRARRWHKVYATTTDSNGEFKLSRKFKRAANYSLKWSTSDFRLRNTSRYLGTRNYNGPKIKGDWNLVITEAKQHQYAHVFRGAYHYYHKNIQGLKRPWTGGLISKMGIAVLSKSDQTNPGLYNFTFGDRITIKTYEQSSEDIYANIMHELAHSVHDNLVSPYQKVYKNVKESWAVGASYVLTRMTYPNHRGRPSDKALPAYTNVVVDMMDTQKDEDDGINHGFGEGTSFDGDSVEGYTIKQIQNALSGQRTWNQWRDNIKNEYENDTKNKMDELFRVWSL